MPDKYDYLINTNEATYKYHHSHSNAVDGVTCQIKQGEFVAILGRNGCGKSTYAKLLNAILLPKSGNVVIAGLNTLDDDAIWQIRSNVGLLYQNPENQIVCSIVEEDVAFGPENLGINPEEIKRRVSQALEKVDMAEFRYREPYKLSGGQKQRIAIAGLLAMEPNCLVLDEGTSMLDPVGRKEIIELVKYLNKQHNMTVIHITHHMEEAMLADRVIVMDAGKVQVDACPEQVFSQVEMLKDLGLDTPQVTELFYNLNKQKLPIDIPLEISFESNAAEKLANMIKNIRK